MRVGFIGLGNQGKPLARNLVRAGHHEVMVYDLQREPLEELGALGAMIGKSARNVAEHAEVVQICVLDDSQLEGVLLGPDGVFDGAAAGTTIVVHSTVSPSVIMKMAETASARGLELMDVPVSGGEQGANNRNMSYMVGGSEAGLAKCRPLFETSGQKITYTGGVGTAIKAKLAHQVIVCGNMLSAYEGMRMGLKAGLSQEILHKVIQEGFGQSRLADAWFTLSLRPHSIPLFYKDLHLCLKFARELGLSMPGAALAQQLIEEIVP